MLDRIKRRFSSINRQQDRSDTLIDGESFTTSKLLFSSSSSSRPTTSEVPAEKEERADFERLEDAGAPLAATMSQVTPRPSNSTSWLFRLPTELLLQLQSYLTLSAEVSLRQSCSRFFDLYTCPSFSLAGDDRFAFLCHLERDDPRPGGARTRLVCGLCRDLHAKSAFPSSELRKPPLQRDCRQVWLCPHRGLGFDKAAHRIRAAETPFRVENLDPCAKCKTLIRNRLVADMPLQAFDTPATDIRLSNNSLAEETLLVSKVGILQKPSPSDARVSGSSLNTEIFPTKDLAAALSGLDFRICPHIRLGDPYILSKFCRSCLKVRILRPGDKGPPCISYTNGGERAGKCQGACYVNGCKTSFMFQTRESLLPDVSGRRQIWLILGIYRWLGTLNAEKHRDDTVVGNDRAEGASATAKFQQGRLWVDHTVDAAAMIEMRIKWRTWMRVYGRRCMPNWSICQLHPEDCNLR